MGKVPAILAFLCLAACGQHSNSYVSSAQTALACPAPPTSSSYSVTVTSGVDSLECKVSPSRKGTWQAELYIGNFPPNQPNLQFFGFASGPSGVLPWFIARPSTSWRTAWWVTYIPTCLDFPSAIELVVHSSRTPTTAQLATISSVAASNMSPNISIQRTRCARR